MRYKGLRIVGDNVTGDVEPGVYALVRRSPQSGEWGQPPEDTYILSATYGKTNQSREPRKRGWLGTTNNVSLHATGCVEVRRGPKGRLGIRKLADNALERA